VRRLDDEVLAVEDSVETVRGCVLAPRAAPALVQHTERRVQHTQGMSSTLSGAGCLQVPHGVARGQDPRLERGGALVPLQVPRPPPSRTDWTRLVPLARTNWTRLGTELNAIRASSSLPAFLAVHFHGFLVIVIEGVPPLGFLILVIERVFRFRVQGAAFKEEFRRQARPSPPSLPY